MSGRVKYDFAINRILDDGSIEDICQGGGELDVLLATLSSQLRTAPVDWAFDLTIVKYGER